ncbi:MAG: pseudouridine synthase [Pseudomonadales bacterium]
MSDSAATDKLHKVLAELGLGSRRQMEQWIAAGRVQVNGAPAHTGQRVGPGDEIRVDGRRVNQAAAEDSRVLVLNKSIGVICSRSDPEGRRSVFDELPPLRQGRWISVGRLDIQTSGLLVLTNDGTLAHRMMHPSTGLDREYAVRVNGRLSDEQLETLRSGVEADGEQLRFSDIRYYNGSGVNHWYHVVLMEGRNHEVRRLFDAVGVNVSRLKRVRFGPLVLPSTLRIGHYLELGVEDLETLYRLLKLPLHVHPKRRRRPRAGTRAQPSVLLPYPELRGVS